MKKLLFVGALAIAGIVSAQENSIKANPAALLGGSDLVTFERKLTDNITGVVGAGIGGFKFGGYKYKSFGAGLQGRYYFNEALRGFYGGVIVDYLGGNVEMDANSFVVIVGGTTTTTQKSEADFSAVGGGLRAGYQWIFGSGFTLDVNLGASYKSYNYKWKTNADEVMYGDKLKGNGILPGGSVGIGYSF